MRKQWVRSDERSWFSLFLGYRGWIAIVATVLLLVLTAFSVWQYQRDAIFTTQLQADAEVIAKSGTAFSQTRPLELTVRYTVPEGQFEGTAPGLSITSMLYDVGDQIVIYYIPSEPRRFATKRMETKMTGPLAQVFAAIFGVIALVSGVLSGLPATRAVRARRYGQFGQAKVLRKAVMYRIKGEGYWWDMWEESDKVRLVYEDDLGRIGRSLPHHTYNLRNLECGHKVNVFQGVHQSWWEGDVGARATVPSALPKVFARPEE